MIARRGVTLVELVVALTIGGMVLALVAAISVRQQRLHADISNRTALIEQLRQASTVLPIELRGIALDAGDLRDARDTAIEFRSTIASAVICDTITGGLVLAPSDGGDTTFSGFLTTIAPGDTAWLFTPGDSADHWVPYSVSSSSTVVAGACPPGGPEIGSVGRTLGRVAIRLAMMPASNAVGAVLRVTRPTRYSLYRGGDGRWYVGARDWNASSNRFNTIQPVSGPFNSAAAHGLEFQYFDSAGTPLATPVARAHDVALIRVAVRGQSRGAMRAFAGTRGKASDSAIVAISLRNRR
jgi:prepilin-type N-terminal cleavage/methylation domain-containing protein